MSYLERLYQDWLHAKQLAKRYGDKPSKACNGASWRDEAARRYQALRDEQVRLLDPDEWLTY